MILPDSNLWIYAADPRQASFAASERAIRAAAEREELLVPAVVQMEVAHVLLRLGAASRPLLEEFFAIPGHRIAMGQEDLQQAIRLLLDHPLPGIGMRDAVLLVQAKAQGAKLLTADKGLIKAAKRVGVKAENPL